VNDDVPPPNWISRRAAEIVDTQRVSSRDATPESAQRLASLRWIERKIRARSNPCPSIRLGGIALRSNDLLIDASRLAGIHGFADTSSR
jgi:hypothetical protein